MRLNFAPNYKLPHLHWAIILWTRFWFAHKSVKYFKFFCCGIAFVDTCDFLIDSGRLIANPHKYFQETQPYLYYSRGVPAMFVQFTLIAYVTLVAPTLARILKSHFDTSLRTSWESAVSLLGTSEATTTHFRSNYNTTTENTVYQFLHFILYLRNTVATMNS